ncbi:hypothetical protein [Paraferrimonas haliotis]|uniref:DUF4870 domain-containing protein n=1 Tax=Paraferrimonas haliotis TaxID=2013866 RepID=A0AA37TN87_9GAMM|nr:hypothetical protein [Paraferrimonas haliotis]GLS82530.1 hypothetical protein GCM10007894_05070 [Paraferrimonas haliotis]
MNTTNIRSSTTEDGTLAHLLYALFLAFPLYGLPAALGFVINLTQSTTQDGSLVANHVRWQRQSACIALLGYGVSIAVAPAWLSMSIVCITASWFAYRIVKGWLRLTDGCMV